MYDSPSYSTLSRGYDVSFEPEKFHIFNRCAGGIDPVTNIYTRFDDKQALDCCKKISKITRTNPDQCMNAINSDNYYSQFSGTPAEAREEKRSYTPEGLPLRDIEMEIAEGYTGPISKCDKQNLRGPKSGQFIDCPPHIIEPFTTTPYTRVEGLCNPVNALDNANIIKEPYTGFLKSKKWVSNKWKYNPRQPMYPIFAREPEKICPFNSSQCLLYSGTVKDTV